MYNASVTKHQPTIRHVIRSTCSRRDRFKSWRSRQSNATPDTTSIPLSRPKPISDTDPAINPATMETRPSTLLYPMVKYSSRWPWRTRSWRFGVVTVATSPLSPERTRGAKIRRYCRATWGITATWNLGAARKFLCSPLWPQRAHVRGRHLRGVDETAPLGHRQRPYPDCRTNALAEQSVRDENCARFETIVLRDIGSYFLRWPLRPPGAVIN